MSNEKAFYLTRAEIAGYQSWVHTADNCRSKPKSFKFRDWKSPTFTMNDALYMFALDPKPPKVNNLNDYIVTAIEEHSITHFYYFLHAYEAILNKRIKRELHNEGIYSPTPEDYMDVKLVYHDYLLKKLQTFDPSHGVQFTSYIEKGKRDPILAAFCLREDWSSTSLSEYKADRKALCRPNDEDDAFRKAIDDYQQEHHCSFEQAYAAVKRPQMRRRRVNPELYDSIGDDLFDSVISKHIGKHYDTSHDYTSDYVGHIFRNETDAKIDKILDKMDEDTVEIMMRLSGICPNCSSVKSLSEADTLEDVAIDFCCSKQTVSHIYHKGLDELKMGLINDGTIEGATIKKVHNSKNKICYEYEIYGINSDGFSGRISFDPATKSGEVLTLANDDDGHYAKGIITYLSNLNSSALPNNFVVPIHPKEV